jgi:hypothetical protein
MIDKSNKSAGVSFTRDAAKQIADAVRIVQSGARRQDKRRTRPNAQASAHYLSKTTGAWTKGTSATLTIYAGDAGSETAQSGQTVVAVNKFSDVAADKWVMLGRASGAWYLIAAECS